MFDAGSLFKQRLIEHVKLLNRYLRYIFNEHFMIALTFIFIALAVYYQKWLENINEDFPAALVIAVILGFVVSYNPIQSFLKAPDEVFIIVKEQAMHRYFRRSLVYNYMVQLFMVILALAVVGPLYVAVYPENDKLTFILLIVVALVLKAWNLVANWLMMKIRKRLIQVLDKTLRTFLSIALFYFFLQGTFVILVVLLYFAAVINNYILSRRQPGLAWDVLTLNDQHRLAFFYRFVSMFADVPQLQKKLKKRPLLARAVNRFIPFKQSATYDYVYRLTFIRSNDYLNLFVRLTIIGAIVLFFIPNLWLKITFALLFLYMTSFQLIPLFHHYRTSIWPGLYPIKGQVRTQAFLKGMKRLSFFQTVIFSCLFFVWLDPLGAVLTFLVGCMFNYVFHNQYVKKKIES